MIILYFIKSYIIITFLFSIDYNKQIYYLTNISEFLENILKFNKIYIVNRVRLFYGKIRTRKILNLYH